MKYHRPEDLFRAEKERAQTVRNSQHARLLAEAKAAFDKLMAEGQAARKSGRPRKHPLPPLKTSSSRTPARPEPVAAQPKPTPAKTATTAKAASGKATKRAEKAATRGTPAKRPAAKKAGAKSKAQRSPKR